MSDRNSQSDLRKEIEDADDTGLVAGEELITQAATMLPLLREQAAFPHEDLHAALPEGHHAHATIEKLHAEVGGASPNPRAIEEHAGALRALPELEAIVANWWDDPKVQRFIANLGQIGL
ncbi:MAG: hypothetical protein WB609_13640 [Candidatus Cybelea sp.]